jgi:cysteine desulfurase
MATVRPIYLDCNATTPVDPRVQEVVWKYLTEEFGNAGSRTHEYGLRAKQAVEKAREQVAAVVGASSSEVIFTSGATESNNIAILGLAAHGEKVGKRHIVSTQIEHKAVLEPLEYLEEQGFEVTLVPPTTGGWVEADRVLDAVRTDTLLVSVMHVNNETGVIQPISKIADGLVATDVYFHTDAAQGYAKDIDPLCNSRIDMISVSGHKIYAPKGIGALVTRRRGFSAPPLKPLLFGGGQERGLRPGTLPVALVVGFGAAAKHTSSSIKLWSTQCLSLRHRLIDTFKSVEYVLNGAPDRSLPNVINISLGNADSEATMLALRDVVSISNGSACTSSIYKPSHVLSAMGLTNARIESATRWSWCHLTPSFDCADIINSLRHIL